MRLLTDISAIECFVVFMGVAFVAVVRCEEECMSGKPYWCYECDSWSDSRCRDPFNWTAPPSELPPSKQCDGCCVKIVTAAHQKHEKIWRTCTKSILINLFMVDHVCMYEGGRTGHMCFCEGDHCNRSSYLRSPSALLLLFISLIACAFNNNNNSNNNYDFMNALYHL